MTTFSKTVMTVLVVAAIAVPARATKPEAIKLNEEGEAFITQADYTKALQKFIEAINTDSVYSEARVNAALTAEFMEDWANVKFQYLTILTYDEENFDALLGAANYFVRVGDFDEARGYFAQATTIDPGSAPLHFGMGGMHHKMKSSKKALSEYKKTIALDEKGFPLAYYRLGRHESEAAKATKDYSKAIMYLSSYVELGKDSDILYSANMDLATIRIKAKEYDQAVVRLSAAKLIKTSDWKPYFYTAEVFRAQGKTRVAEKEYLATLEKKPGHGESHYRLALMFQEQYKDEEAMMHYQEAAKDKSFKNRTQARQAAAALESLRR